MTDSPVVDDYIVLAVPDNASAEDEDTMDMLEHKAELTVAGQYTDRRPKAILFLKTEWLITSDWREVERFQPDHECVACRAGNDQAMAFLKEHPTKRLALGNLHYMEVW